jgi:hypothetical protein
MIGTSIREDGNMSQQMIAYCGLTCSECGAFLATQNNDKRKREEVASLWSRLYKVDIQPAEINCLGCLSDETLFAHCRICAIRKCGQEKRVTNCAYCPDYGCDKLDSIHRVAPDARKKLEEIRSGNQTVQLK